MSTLYGVLSAAPTGAAKLGGANMKLIKLIPPGADSHCGGERDCPAVYDDLDTDEFAVIQGYVVDAPPFDVPAGEGMIRFPKAQLRALAAQLAGL